MKKKRPPQNTERAREYNREYGRTRRAHKVRNYYFILDIKDSQITKVYAEKYRKSYLYIPLPEDTERGVVHVYARLLSEDIVKVTLSKDTNTTDIVFKKKYKDIDKAVELFNKAIEKNPQKLARFI